MKQIILIVALVVTSSLVNAQHFHWNPGLKAGLNLATLSGGSDEVDNGMNTSFNAGVLVHMHYMKHWALQPELMFSGQGTEYTFVGENVHLNLCYINLPVQLQYMFANGLRLQSGPQVGFLVSAKSKVEGEDAVDVDDGFNTIDFSWVFGVSYIHRSGFGVDARYNLGISNVSEDDAEKVRNSVIQAGLFYQFKGKAK